MPNTQPNRHEPPHVHFAVVTDDGAILDSGEGTVGEVAMLRETLALVFPRLELRVETLQ